MTALNEEQLRERRSVLVDKKSTEGLTVEEAFELSRINFWLEDWVIDHEYVRLKETYAMFGVTLRSKRGVARSLLVMDKAI